MSTPFLAAFVKAIIIALWTWLKSRSAPALSDSEPGPEHPKWGGELRRLLPKPDEKLGPLEQERL